MFKCRTYRVDVEPMQGDDVGTEEECGTLLGLLQKVGGKESNPFEDGESGTRFENEHSNSLLNDQSDNHSGPLGYQR